MLNNYYSGKAARGKFSVAFFFVIFRVAIGYARMRSASITSFSSESPSFAVTWRLARLFLDSVFSPFTIERHLCEIH